MKISWKKTYTPILETIYFVGTLKKVILVSCVISIETFDLEETKKAVGRNNSGFCLQVVGIVQCLPPYSNRPEDASMDEQWICVLYVVRKNESKSINTDKTCFQ